jgi:hypothetical protein
VLEHAAEVALYGPHFIPFGDSLTARSEFRSTSGDDFDQFGNLRRAKIGERELGGSLWEQKMRHICESANRAVRKIRDEL